MAGAQNSGRLQGDGGYERRRSLKLWLPGGARLEIRGYDFLLVLICSAIGILGYIAYDNRQTRQEYKRERIEEHKALVANQVKMQEIMEEQTYVITLDTAAREKLNLRMPRSMRDKIRKSAEAMDSIR